MFNWILEKIAGDYNQRQINKILPIVKKINEIDKSWDSLSDEQIKAKTFEFKQRLKKGETLDDILPEAFATVKQACKRLRGTKISVKGQELVWDMVPYDVQLIGGIVLHQGKIAEMKTGEGKTLVATLPAYLNALEGKGVHIVTVNDYLASRDAEWMGYLYNWLGLSVGAVTKQTPIEARKSEYEKDITYVENSELGFDYLRDNLAKSIQERVLLRRPLNYAIVDEADSILIDEARTPLIISAPSEEPTEKYKYYAQIVKALIPCKGKKKKPANLLKKLMEEEESSQEENCDYYIDEKTKTVTLTSKGIAKLENLLGVENLYKDLGYEEIHHIENALKALAVYHKDKDYIVRDGEVLIVDENTGRVMPGRRYSEGLHQAIEAKEGVEIQKESKTLASITYQHFFKKYKKLAGMTGTAATEGEEFENIYGLEVIVIPTNKPVIRVDKNDKVFFDQEAKWNAVVETIKFYHEIGQPILIGTSSIATSELVSSILRKMNIPHYVLNAKYHEQEAQIVANAGKLGSVVVATNMAGRGTDIKLQPGLNEILAQNYAKWIQKIINGDNYTGEKPKAVSAVVYSEKEFELTIEGIKKIFGLNDEFIRNAEKDWTSNGKISMKIKFNTKKKTKDQPFAEIIIKPADQKEPEIIQKDFHYGLFILGTEKHEARRIDNQLRGRAGRQGDPGVSVFYVALDDEIMRKMGGDKIKAAAMMMAGMLGGKEELRKMELNQKQFTNAIQRAQKQMEAWHFSIRKHLYDYDKVIAKQRDRIYEKRDEILGIKNPNYNVIEEIEKFIPDIVEKLVDTYTANWSYQGLAELAEELNQITGANFTAEQLEKLGKPEKIKKALIEEIKQLLNKKTQQLLTSDLTEEQKQLVMENLKNIIKNIYLNVIDRLWIDHIDDMTYLRDKVGLYGYAQQDPLAIYKKEAFEKFQKLLFNIKKETLARTLRTNFDFIKQQLFGQTNISTPQTITVSTNQQQNNIIDKLKNVSKNIKEDNSTKIIELKQEKEKNIQSLDDGIEIIELNEEEQKQSKPIIVKKKIGPNDPCPCGSGKKYKKCCGKK